MIFSSTFTTDYTELDRISWHTYSSYWRCSRHLKSWYWYCRIGRIQTGAHHEGVLTRIPLFLDTTSLYSSL